MFYDAQDTKSSSIDLLNVGPVIDSGIRHLSIARRRPREGFIHKKM